jgi:SAM-dependent methyltransferase
VNDASLTDERFWRSYWSSKRLIRTVDESERFFSLLRDSIAAEHRSFVELGGFPGVYAILARKHLGLDATLVDLVVEHDLLERLLAVNGLAAEDVQAIQADLFAYVPDRSYDVVFSNGLVEHFEDPERILSAHAELAAPGALVLVTLPNFRGVNGLVQLCFDRGNLRLHNLGVMRRSRLLRAAAACGLERAEAFHYGGFEVWLERLEERAAPLRWLVRVANAAGRRLLRFESARTSSHLVLRAWKPAAGA